jgi:hypothetical protein
VAKEAEHATLAIADHEALRIEPLERAWWCDVAAHGIRELAGEGPFLVGGDWNNARLFDQTMTQFGGASARFFAQLESWGWQESMRAFYDVEVQTYFDERSASYQLDHVFTSKHIGDRLVACDVLAVQQLRELSGQQVGRRAAVRSIHHELGDALDPLVLCRMLFEPALEGVTETVDGLRPEERVLLSELVFFQANGPRSFIPRVGVDPDHVAERRRSAMQCSVTRNGR